MASSTFRARDRAFQSGCGRVAVTLRPVGTGSVAARNGPTFRVVSLASSVVRRVLQDAVEAPADRRADQRTHDPNEDVRVDRATDECGRERAGGIDGCAAE